MYARGVLEDALKTSKNVGRKKKQKTKPKKKQNKTAVIIYDSP